MATRVQSSISHLKFGVRVVLLVALLLVLTSCGRAYTVIDPAVTLLDAAMATGQLQYLEDLREGPLYGYTFDVPADWVGSVVLRNEGNRLWFDYIVTEGTPASPIFSIMALSRNQFWEQTGGYPGQYGDIVFTGDTYFIYQLPVDAHYSGLSDDAYASLSAQVPEVITTFQVEALP